jgi:hypothetical protein
MNPHDHVPTMERIAEKRDASRLHASAAYDIAWTSPSTSPSPPVPLVSRNGRQRIVPVDLPLVPADLPLRHRLRVRQSNDALYYAASGNDPTSAERAICGL